MACCDSTDVGFTNSTLEHLRSSHQIRTEFESGSLQCAVAVLLAELPATAPTAVCALQYVECIYLIWKGSWVLPAILLTISLAADLKVVAAVRQQHITLTGLINQRRIVPIVTRRGWVRALPSYKLVPGDVVVMQRGKASCDMVLLRGSCLVEESMLSGEVT